MAEVIEVFGTCYVKSARHKMCVGVTGTIKNLCSCQIGASMAVVNCELKENGTLNSNDVFVTLVHLSTENHKGWYAYVFGGANNELCGSIEMMKKAQKILKKCKDFETCNTMIKVVVTNENITASSIKQSTTVSLSRYAGAWLRNAGSTSA